MSSFARFSPALVLPALVAASWASFHSRAALQLEILALRHQLGVLHRSVKRPKLTSADRVLSEKFGAPAPLYLRAPFGAGVILPEGLQHRPVVGAEGDIKIGLHGVEGFFDCMRLFEAGYPTVALMGRSASDEQVQLLSAYFRHVVLMLDGDKAGRAGTDECLVKLGRRGVYVRAVLLADGKAPDEMTAGELGQALRY